MKSRFGPHPFNRNAVVDFYQYNAGLTGYVAIDITQQEIIAYAIIKTGILQHEYDRLVKYGSGNINSHCCSFAPSVADKWQSRGIGKMLFSYILNDLYTGNIKQVILWGGVQASNEKAVNFYRKLGFQTMGSFEYNGANFDMLLEIG
ncbi:MAG: GNAT family N-acetyltransferase [Chitinophagaceae bacterium]|nr:GNAT family N-acetyltransferase [Chitinophagaceae bacterium]